MAADIDAYEHSGCQAITSLQAPAAIGPYSQAVVVDKLLFVSGQLPIDPASGKLVQGGIDAQTNQILKNIAMIAHAAGTDLHKTIKTMVFMMDLDSFAEMNDVYSHYFGAVLPARSTVQVSRLPKGAQIEIEAIISIG